MNKLAKKILNISLALLLAGFLFLPSLASANGLLNIAFEEKPLFQETNFLPGQSITRWIDVENKSSETQPIAVEVIDYSSCTVNCFSEQLELNISNGSTDIYTESLDQFFNAGDIKLSDLAAGNTIRYHFTVTFLPQSGNQYQEKAVSFDFKIGSLGKESIGDEITPGGGSSGGGFFITGLEIFNETIASVEETQATITWETNKEATSRVIYSSEYQPHVLLLDSPPNYGYANSTLEDSSLKVFHSMVVSGLQPATTYYFRCISRGSLAVSKELKFTTASVKGEEIISDLPVVPPPFTPDILGEEIEGEEAEELIIEEDDLLEEALILEEETEIVSEGGTNLCWLLLLILIILIILSLLHIKKKHAKKKWIFPLLTLIAAVIYYFLCCLNCWILMLVGVILLILSLIFGQKNKETASQEVT